MVKPEAGQVTTIGGTEYVLVTQIAHACSGCAAYYDDALCAALPLCSYGEKLFIFKEVGDHAND